MPSELRGAVCGMFPPTVSGFDVDFSARKSSYSRLHALLRARSRSLILKSVRSLIEYPWTFPRARQLYRRADRQLNRRSFITMDDAVSMLLDAGTAGDRYFLLRALCLPSVYIRISRSRPRPYAPDDFRLRDSTDIFRDVFPPARRYPLRSSIFTVQFPPSAIFILANANARDHITIIIIIIYED